MPGPHFFEPINLIAETLFTVLAVAFCFAIYFKTKEIFELTKYKGIEYFRTAFLFFGLSYLVRLVFGLMMFSAIELNFHPAINAFSLILILLLGYFSTAGIFYLLFTFVWKRFDNKKMVLCGHLIAILLSVIVFITRSHMILLMLQTILLLAGVIVVFLLHDPKKKISQINVLYYLVSALWLMNLWVLDRGRPFFFGVEMLFYLLSIAVFLYIYYKVFKWVK